MGQGKHQEKLSHKQQGAAANHFGFGCEQACPSRLDQEQLWLEEVGRLLKVLEQGQKAEGREGLEAESSGSRVV